ADPRRTTPFPYTTLFRSPRSSGGVGGGGAGGEAGGGGGRVSRGAARANVGCGARRLRDDAEQPRRRAPRSSGGAGGGGAGGEARSEEHTSELQSPCNLVC